jgi:hypothetical protein
MTDTIELTYTAAQLDVFFNIPPGVKYNIITKGRRFGATRGGAHAFIEWCLEGKKLLWGDTINGNIDRYFERYFLPALKKNKIDYNYHRQKKQLTIGHGYIDFRSSDQPENWEGFGYDIIFLNEAGIILNNKYLYTNAVLPMLIDNPRSVLIAAGVPKGKLCRGANRKNEEHPFFTLYKAAKNNSPKYRLLEYSSYDNPLLSAEEIGDLEVEIARMSPGMVEQEIYGHFVDSISGVLWTADMIQHCKELPKFTKIAIGLDPSGSATGDEVGIVAVGRAGDKYYVLSDRSGGYSPNQWGMIVKNEYDALRANTVVAERNFGGDMVKAIILNIDRGIYVKDVIASRGKEVRAEPIVGLYEQGKVFHATGLFKLENEMMTWVPGVGKSPNRVDSLVWAITYLSGNADTTDVWL